MPHFEQKGGTTVNSCKFCTGVLFFAAAAVALAQSQSPSSPQRADLAASSVPCTPRAVEIVDPKTYCIESSDVLYVLVWREPEFTRLVSVRSNGKITLPMIWDVQAAGITPAELQRVLIEKLAPYVERPDVRVTVQEIGRTKEKKSSP
jgi:polysaccharide export outer membrane protein